MKKPATLPNRFIYTASFTGLMLLCFPALALQAPVPAFQPKLEISRAAGTINIDGKLNDPGWKNAAHSDNFVERRPGDNTAPQVNTDVYVTYDDNRLYVSFLCRDNPVDIRATMCPRDEPADDDLVSVLIDTYGTAIWAYEFYVNPYGVQMDWLLSGLGMEDPGFDLTWESAGQITDSGYQVELAIPFAGLRFPDKDVQSWRMDFRRNRPRESSYQYSWAANDHNEQCWPCQWGTIDGITNVFPGKGIEILPAFVGHQFGEISDRENADSRFQNEHLKGEMSMGGKYSLSSDVTFEAAINPDFSQVEADADQIDVNSPFALMFPEKRPFFQEGRDIFETLFNSFYTRMINDPQFAAKMTGRIGQTSLGFLSAIDDNTPYIIPLNQSSITINTGKSVANILRGSYAFGESSKLGFIINDRRFESGGTNTVLSADGTLRLSKDYGIAGQFIVTHTRELDDTALTSGVNADKFDNDKHTIGFDGESFSGNALIGALYRRARHWNFTISYDQIDPTYRTETGFDPVNGNRSVSINTSFTIYPKSSVFQQLAPGIEKFTRWYYDGHKIMDYQSIGLQGELNLAQIHFAAAYGMGSESYAGILFDDQWTLELHVNSRISDQFGLGADFSHGREVSYSDLADGNETDFALSSMVKPLDRLTIECNFNSSRMTVPGSNVEFFDGYITRTKLQYQATRQFSVRLVAQYNDFEKTWDIDPLFTFRISPFSVFYAGSTYDYNDMLVSADGPSKWRMTSRQFFMKLQYLVQI